VDLKRQNRDRLKVGTDEPKLKVKMQSVSDDDDRKRLIEKPRFELAAEGVFRLGLVLHEHTSELRGLTYRMGSHSVAFHLTQVNSPHLSLIPVRHVGTRFTYSGGMED